MRFVIADHDFGEEEIMALDVHPQFTFDGCLGMDFLSKHPVFIDYRNQYLLIDLADAK